MSILPVLKVKMESRCNLLTTILYDSFLSFSMMVKDIGPVRVLRRLKEYVSVSAILSCRPFFILIFLPYIKMRHYGFSRKSIWKNLETFP